MKPLRFSIGELPCIGSVIVESSRFTKASVCRGIGSVLGLSIANIGLLRI